MARARIGNNRLWFYEDNIAAASSIAHRLKALMYHIDDPAQLLLIADMMRDVTGIFERNKTEMQAAKQAAKEAGCDQTT